MVSELILIKLFGPVVLYGLGMFREDSLEHQ